MCEVILIAQSVAMGLLLVTQVYWFNQVRKSEVATEEPKVTFTGVPVMVFEDERIVVSAQDGIAKGTEVAVIRVIARDTNKLSIYIHNKKEDHYVRVPGVGAVMSISGTTIKEVTYPLEMTS